jgi:hypothetical protein
MSVDAHDQATQMDAEERLAELLKRWARVANAARFDSELRAELDDIDAEILACKRQLGEFCLECGSRLLVVDGANTCCWSPCIRYGHPIQTEQQR